MTPLTCLPSISGTNQDYVEYPVLLTTMMTLSMHLPGTSNILTTNKHADHQHATRSPRRPPSFISCPNGTLFCVHSCNKSQKILDASCMDLENILLLQGQFCSRQLLQMSEVFTINAQEQALLQGPKTPEFVKTLHQLYHFLQPVLTESNHIFHQKFLLKIVTRTNNNKIIYVLMVISTMIMMIMMMMMKTLVMHHYFHR